MPTNFHLHPWAGDLLGAFTRASHWIWDRRGTAKLRKFPFSEETVTEAVLLNISSEAPSCIQILPLTKKQESKIGADWEWVFFNSAENQFVRWLVQAKVLDNADKQYAHIDRYIGNTDVRQIDRLRKTAKDRGIPAIYAFYNHLSMASRLPPPPCLCAQCAGCWGFAIALAEAVYSTLPDKTFDKLAPLSMPLVCAICPSTNPGSESVTTLAINALRTLRGRLGEEWSADVTGQLLDPEQYIRSDPPDYFRSIRRSEITDELLRDIERDNPGIDGIVLITDSPRPANPE